MTSRQGIRYSLRESFGNKEKYSAHTASGNKIEIEKLSEKMATKLPGLHELDVRRVMEQFKQEIIDSLCNGDTISLKGFLFISPSIVGHFESPGDVYTPERHKIKVNITGSKSLTEEVNSKATVRKELMNRREPIINDVYDLVNKSCNSLIMVGSYVRIEGKNLSFNPEAEDEGVYIYSYDRTKGIKINYRDSIENRVLRFIVPPEIEALGDKVIIEVKSRMKTKTMRQGVSHCALTVLGPEQQT